MLAFVLCPLRESSFHISKDKWAKRSLQLPGSGTTRNALVRRIFPRGDFPFCFASLQEERGAGLTFLWCSALMVLLLFSTGRFWLCKENRIWKENMDFLWHPGVRSPRDHPEQRSRHFGRLLVTGNLNVWAPDWQVWASGLAPLRNRELNLSAVVTLIRPGTGSEPAQRGAAEPQR